MQTQTSAAGHLSRSSRLATVCLPTCLSLHFRPPPLLLPRPKPATATTCAPSGAVKTSTAVAAAAAELVALHFGVEAAKVVGLLGVAAHKGAKFRLKSS